MTGMSLAMQPASVSAWRYDLVVHLGNLSFSCRRVHTRSMQLNCLSHTAYSVSLRGGTTGLNLCSKQSNHLHLQRLTGRHFCPRKRHVCATTASTASSTQADAKQLSQSLPDSREQAVSSVGLLGTVYQGSTALL